MKTTHALGFLLLGFVLSMVPRLAPGLFPPLGIDGTSTRELWLQFMSWVVFAIGGTYFCRQLLGLTASLLEYDPARAKARAAAPRPAFARAFRRPETATAFAAVGEPELLEFAPAWLAERGAA